ncbi:MAG: A/G-specific adenine glycosylase [Bacteroidota bacterium]
MSIAGQIISWYHQKKRDLPWRNTSDPYKIWVSEIILQQTRVAQGRAYYEKFMNAFPDVKTLAAAREEDVLLLWQGLGYYSRARNMHYAARQVVHELDGKFPATYSELLKLKGVGEYTAGAIASFAYNLPHPAVDGNVSRVISRIFNISEDIASKGGRQKVQEAIHQMMPADNPGVFNQAIMEFGALQCVPQNPDCEVCPLKAACASYEAKTVHKRPVKTKKKKPVERYLNYLVFEETETGNVVLQKRHNPKDIWYNLYEFPLIESQSPVSQEQIAAEDLFRQYTAGNEVVIKPPKKPVKHLLSHQRLYVYFWRILLKGKISAKDTDNMIKTSEEGLAEYPFPRLISAYAEENFEKYKKNETNN